MSAPALPRVCSCHWTDPKTWTRYGGAIEPGSTMEPNLDCPEHFPARKSVAEARAELDRADAAYTLAVQTASRSNQWAFVQAAAEAVHQARAALKEAEGEQ